MSDLSQETPVAMNNENIVEEPSLSQMEEPKSELVIVINEVNNEPKVGEYIGQCKWFNDNLGFGFLTVQNGDMKGKDIFVHHTGIKPLNSNYKSLKKGEYVNFDIVQGDNGQQANNVTGIGGGSLICDVTPFHSSSSPVVSQKFATTSISHVHNNRSYPPRQRNVPAHSVQRTRVPPMPTYMGNGYQQHRGKQSFVHSNKNVSYPSTNTHRNSVRNVVYSEAPRDMHRVFSAPQQSYVSSTSSPHMRNWPGNKRMHV